MDAARVIGVELLQQTQRRDDALRLRLLLRLLLALWWRRRPVQRPLRLGAQMDHFAPFQLRDGEWEGRTVSCTERAILRSQSE